MAEYVDRDRLLHIFSLDRWSKYDPAEVRTLIMSVTPEDVQPVAHAKWTEHQQGNWTYVKCSRCEAVHYGCTNFCPTCGADMRECET